jgi:hypothetical protein
MSTALRKQAPPGESGAVNRVSTLQICCHCQSDLTDEVAYLVRQV